MAKLGARTFRYDSRPPIAAGAAIVGPKEGEGPLGGYFDEVVDDDYLGKDTYEQAEAELMTRAAHLAMKKARMKPDELNAMLGGDLEQQILAASITARTLGAVCTTTWRVGSSSAAHTFSVSSRSTRAAVGQTVMHWPQPMQVESASLPSKAQAMWVLKPRSTTLITPTPWFSAQVEMQRRQMMHLELSFKR